MQEAEIHLRLDNIAEWPLEYQQRLKDGEFVFDKRGQLRYRHGAPVGKLILVYRDDYKGDPDLNSPPYYALTVGDWFAPDSKEAQEFVWPDAEPGAAAGDVI